MFSENSFKHRGRVHHELKEVKLYNEKCIASLRYSMAHPGSIFEMRIDAYMRNHRLKKVNRRIM